MSTLSAKEYKCFEDIKRIRPDGSEYWAARELAPVLDYAKWENFYKVIKRAMIACENSGRSTLECFPEVRKTSPMPNGGVKDILDYELSRYACYLIVQNGDPRKEVIALGQTYFAIQTYSDGWLEMTAITAPDSDLCRYAIYKSGFAAFGVDLYSLQLYPNEGKLSQQSEVLRAAADFGLCEDTCDGTEIITRGEAAELLYALLTKTFAVVPPPMLDNIPLDNKAGVALNNYLLEIQKIPESMMQSFAEKDWRYVIDFDYLAKLSKEYDLGCTGVTIYEGRKIIVSSAESTIHEFGHFLDGMMGFPSRTKGFYQRESASAASLLRTYALTDAQEYFADCFVYWIKNRGDGKKMAMLQDAAPETYYYFKMLEENDWKPSLSS